MIYIADDPSDVPAFSVVKWRGGATFAIYPAGDNKAFEQVERLREDSRIDMFAEADYSDGKTASMKRNPRENSSNDNGPIDYVDTFGLEGLDDDIVVADSAAARVDY